MSRRPLKAHRLMANDRRRSAVHEAGHYVVAHHVGLRNVRAQIFRRSERNVLEEPTWGGNCGVPWMPLSRLSDRRRIMFSVAGAVAEQAWDDYRGRERLDELCFEDLLIEPDAMSATDWDGCGCLPGEPNLKLVRCAEQVAELLTPHGGALWPLLLQTSRSLIRNGWITSEKQAANAGRRHR
ncbi:hypothetical protein M0638_28285 [Roseomonas sp. NAR14]|uniref:Peptidase M41-like protein n=1 Tax=Roseomonas acroporae TaxID=2937791 RepID=A0A9X1YCH5_9PROT|nr:hypothetical protein [Roseomonas acroporae]MCK8788254.1 hypothetical protein [Roseomonas acroporae]